MASLMVRDEGWRLTSGVVRKRLAEPFGGVLPAGFELHAMDLLSPKGDGFFKGRDRDERSSLALDLLDIITTRKHQVLLQVYDKSRLATTNPPPASAAFPWNDPWELGFAMTLTMFENFLRSKQTGSSSSGLIVIDHERSYLKFVRAHCADRNAGKGWRQVAKVVDIGYSAASHANPMIQVADLVAYVSRRHAEVQAKYKEALPPEAVAFFAECHRRVWPRVLYKDMSLKALKTPVELGTYIKAVRAY
ncbi:MAG: DUF3800 domain-containing protein [Actinomycetota bacterium]|nr:DUF3800 domain-containing protein [Actinomycetota bacterium]